MTQETDYTDRIVTSIAEREQQDVRDLEPPLNDAVDMDALAEVVESDAVREVEFSYLDYTVVVDDEGAVRVSDAEFAPRQRGKLG